MGASFDPDRIAAMRAELERSARAASGSSAAPGSSAPSAFRPPASTSSGTPGRAGALKLLWQRAIALTLGFVAVLYSVEGVDTLAHHDLDGAGVKPRSTAGLEGIVFAPLLHASWTHLIGNTLPVIVLGMLTLLSGIGRGLAATAIIWIVAGAGTWLTGGSGTVHLGASVLVFGWLTYILCRGLFTRTWWQLLLGAVVGVLYGSVLWGVLPGQPGISWQGHLFGAVGGVLAGWVLSGNERRHRRGESAGPLASSR
ncbi:MAG: rhomboid family intramembrane serine protease [Nocardia sp.]|nr:rhomboid family intramembrane serine protease [Nocardia sp.]